MADKTALLVIDLQTAMFTEGEPPHCASALLEVVASLLERARASRTPVIFVRHIHATFEPMRPGSPGFEIHADIAPLPGETIIDKTACDAFCETPLAAVLERLGVERLVIVGMQTEYCVDTACRSALHRGYDVVLAADGHSTVGNGVVSAEQIIAHHNKTLGYVPRPGHRIVVMPGAEIDFAAVEAEAETALAV